MERTISVVELAGWGFYREFHRVPRTFFVIYLIAILISHILIRTAMFVEVHYKDVLKNFNYADCLLNFAETFPEDLRIDLQTSTHELTFFKSDQLLEKNQDISLSLPQCGTDVVSVSLAFFAKSSLSHQLLWEGVDAVITLTNTPPQPPLISAFNELFLDLPYQARKPKVDFLTVTPKKAVLIEFIPVSLFASLQIRSLCERRDQVSIRGIDNKASKICTLDKRSLLTKAKLLKQQKSKPSDSGKLIFGLISARPFWRRISVVMLSMGVCILMCVMDTADLFFTSMIIQIFLQWRFLRRLLFLRPEHDLALNQLVVSQMNVFNLTVCTSTPFFILSTFFTFPVADLYGMAQICHVFYTLLVLRFLVLPSMAARSPGGVEFLRMTLGEDYQLEVVASETDHENDLIASHDTRSAGENFQKYLEWEDYIMFQRMVLDSIVDKEKSRNQRYEQIFKLHNMYIKQHLPELDRFFHVWSCYNNFRSTDETSTSGPGFCYALCPRSGAFLLVGWYESIESESGIRHLTRFPGQIIISKDVCPVDGLLISESEILDLEIKLSELKKLYSQTFGSSES